MFVYLDNASTTKPYESVVQKMGEAMLHNFGNPSSLHKLGMNAEKEVKDARHIVAESLGAKDQEIFFTSGGTEADNTVIAGVAYAKKATGNNIITTKVEHPAVLECCKNLEKEGFHVTYLDVNEKCQLDLEQLKSSINDKTTLVSTMMVNNETGTILPTKQIGEYLGTKKNGGKKIAFHSDAIQAYGKFKLDIRNIDFLSLSGHKIHGPKGIGAFYAKNNSNFKPLLIGGGQERNLRSGTENVQGIVGLGQAAKESYESLHQNLEQIGKVRNYLLEGIKTEIKDIKINGYDEMWQQNVSNEFSPTILNISFHGIRGEVLLHTLEQEGIYVSTRSACSSSKISGSHVLKAMGLRDGEIEGAIRFSFSQFNTIDEMDYVLHKLKQGIDKMRTLSNFNKRGKK